MITISYNPLKKTLLFHNEKGKVTGGYCGSIAQTRYLDFISYLADKVNYESLLEISQTIGVWLAMAENQKHPDYQKRLRTQQYIVNQLTEIENNK